MEDLEPYKIKNLDIKLERKGDLIYHEGVLLSHFIDISHISHSNFEHYFYKWCDCDENCNRWAIFKVELTSLKLFFEGKITLLQLIEENSFIFFKDIDNNLDSVGVYVCPISKIPQDYLPDNNSYFKESLYEKYALELREKIKNGVVIKDILFKETIISQRFQSNTIFFNSDKIVTNIKSFHYQIPFEPKFYTNFPTLKQGENKEIA